MPSPMSGKDTLDKILLDCIRFGVRCSPRIPVKDLIELHPFEFVVNSHSTGNSVNIFLYNKDRSKKLEIVNGTFWFHETYTRNPFKWLSGAWDESLEKAIETLREEVFAAKSLALEKQNKEKEERLAREKAERDEFESQFLV